MLTPEVQYTESSGVRIAYQVFGEGPYDVVYAPSHVTHVELIWTIRPWADFLARLGGLGRVIVFDKRGSGLSDRSVGLPGMEERMDDIRAVIDAAGSQRAAVVGTSEGGTMCALFAATFPERCWAQILWGSLPRLRFARDYRGGWRPRRSWRSPNCGSRIIHGAITSACRVRPSGSCPSHPRATRRRSLLARH